MNAWRTAVRYVGQGVAVVRRAPHTYLLITLAYAAPALVAGTLAAWLPEPNPWQQAIILGLPWLTIVLGTVVIMVVVSYQARGQTVDPGRATRVAIRWAPRYVWTNAHTSVIFWAPMGLLFAVRAWQAHTLVDTGLPAIAVDGAWWLLTAGLALYLHTRTLLAPFLAVHADLPGTLAAVEAWRLCGQHFRVCFATLVLGSLPVGLPLGLIALAVARSLSESVQAAMLAGLPDLTWAGIQAVRPVLVAALYPLYQDLWTAEQARRQREGPPRVPSLARPLLAATQALPKLGRWD